LATWEWGTTIPTEYDQEVDPESRDATTMIIVASPFAEPRIHRALPCGLDELKIYTQEVVAGVHDHLVGKSGWSYSYHDRLCNWPGIDGWKKLEDLVGEDLDLPHVDQINTLIHKLAQTPHSRRAQATTWHPLVDALHDEPPCLQRVWCRVVRSDRDSYLLEMNTHWRSRDALKAAFMNMFALTEFQRGLATVISRASSRQIEAGRYVDVSDSFHIYGSYIRRDEMEKFLTLIQRRSFDQRTWRTDERIVQQEFERGSRSLSEENS